jgi:hypothetical protein
MPPSSFSVFVNPLLPQNSIELGRLIVDVKTPWQDFCPSASVALTKADITVNSSFRIRDMLAKSKGTRFHLGLTKFLTSFYTTEKDAVSSVVATEATSYMLLNSRLHLGRICKDQVTRDWLETVIKEGWNAYMIVGIHTVKDAEVTHNHRNAVETKASIQLPVDALAAPGAVPGDIANFGAGAEKWRELGESSSFVAPGEQVIAIQYRKLKFKWFSSRALEFAYLEKGNRWKVYLLGDKAEPGEDAQDVEDVVEAEFEEIAAINVDDDHESFVDTDAGGEWFLV